MWKKEIYCFQTLFFYTLKENYVTLWADLVLQAQLARPPQVAS